MTVRRVAALAAFNVAALFIVVAFASLAVWQVERRAWKLDLVARVEMRLHTDPIPAPISDRSAVAPSADDEYRRVFVRGRWLDIRPAIVRAVTKFGEGYWVLSPFARDQGGTVLINRGFVPSDRVPDIPKPSVAVLSGKLRLSEPNGGFLRSNDPAAEHWFSRDVAAIAASRHLTDVAPYFIDAEDPTSAAEFPIPGLTVLAFSNNHLVYAVTWAALALMSLVGAIFINVDAMRAREPV